MFILGLTGSIGMGKSTVSRISRRLGVPVFDADLAARQVTATDGAAIPALQMLVPDCFTGNILDRQKLAQYVFADDVLRQRVEAIIHPLVQRLESIFIEQARRAGHKMVVLDIPLLFETGADRRVDAVAVVSAPADIQRQRVLARSGMTEARFRGVLAAQMSDGDKRARADIIIPTGGTMRDTIQAVATIIRQIQDR